MTAYRMPVSGDTGSTEEWEVLPESEPMPAHEPATAPAEPEKVPA